MPDRSAPPESQPTPTQLSMHLAPEGSQLGVAAVAEKKDMSTSVATVVGDKDTRTYPWHEKGDVYGLQHDLQNFDICLPRPLDQSSKDDSVWIIFIHGGAWRDPDQDKSELQPALSQLLASPSSPTLKHIAGLVSLNYGLSTYPPSDESHDPSLRVQHPKHISDLVVALSYLEEKYGVGANTVDDKGYDYVIVGHSAGAFLGFQSLTHQCDCATYRPARAIVGLAGIYDLPLVVANHTDEPFYRQMVAGAFGDDETLWRDVSPAHGKYEDAWQRGGLEFAILGASTGDVLVEAEQWQEMQKSLEAQGWHTVEASAEALDKRETESGEKQKAKEILVLPLEGAHDDIWQLGDGVRKSIELVIERLFPPRS